MDEGVDQGNILIVDDTPENLNVLRKILIREGYKVRPAISGDIALKAVEIELPDLILLDIIMPDMDGFEVCRRLKADASTKDIPVIFISALNELGDKVKAFTEGGIDYILKPFQNEEVLVRIRTHLNLHRLRREVERKNAELQKAFDEIKTLRGILPICSSCKKIRNDEGFWEQIETYVRHHSEAEFSHGICDECAKKLYPDYTEKAGK